MFLSPSSNSQEVRPESKHVNENCKYKFQAQELHQKKGLILKLYSLNWSKKFNSSYLNLKTGVNNAMSYSFPNVPD